ncbi:MAG: tRNA pseudouridine(55) synthase TruB [Acidobacteria bacterium]|nr:MAG: tRNA pseudouridine(55) synthase TruB [Acidobacteriota bacterium]
MSNYPCRGSTTGCEWSGTVVAATSAGEAISPARESPTNRRSCFSSRRCCGFTGLSMWWLVGWTREFRYTRSESTTPGVRAFRYCSRSAFMADIDGLLIIDKPEGMTSHDVVDRVRRALGMKRVGHTGTLDPLATGVLVLCLGRATRLQRFFVGSDKEYIARIRLGFATDTYDRTGKPVSPMGASNRVVEEQVKGVLKQLQGTRPQIPPMYSAKKRAGTRLYTLARRGQQVPRKAIRVTIDTIEPLLEGGVFLHRHPDGTSDFSVRIRCSAGTYIRSLAHEIGERLGCGGHLVALRRTAVGSFRLEQAVGLGEFERLAEAGRASERIIPLDEIPLDMPAVILSPREVEKVRHGQSIERRVAAPGQYCRLLDAEGHLLAIGEVMARGATVQPRIVLY